MQITPNKKRYARTNEQEQQRQPVNGEAKGVLEKVKGGAADHLHRDSHAESRKSRAPTHLRLRARLGRL